MSTPEGRAVDGLTELERGLVGDELTVAILGLGYVGLPLATTFAEAGVRVVGIDIDEHKPERIARGSSYIGAVSDERLARIVEDGLFTATTDFTALAGCHAVLICVPTPLNEDREPDLSFILATARSIRDSLRPGQLVVLESTTYPGTTREVLLPILEENGLRCGEDFLLAFSPEREDPGNPAFHTGNITKVVGGVDERATRAAASLYRRVVPEVVEVESAEIAEASKLTENIFRAVNIALVNELKVVYERLGIDVRAVLDAAETKPFGFMRFDPGPGWGGHCIPVDPFYLQWRAQQVGATARFIELAGEINVEMPAYVAQRIADEMKRRSDRELAGAKVLILGLAYKKNVADPRESPAFELIDRLLAAGVRVEYHDPHLLTAPSMRSWPQLPVLESVPLDAERLASADAVVVITDHDAVDYAQVLEHAQLIVDSRGVFRPNRFPDARAALAAKVVSA